ncbi:hypothetical protein GDO78_019705 [Eleutherodactylus coqui]|uniref:Uncharacterized protein n=1 Tax=Eleutherodactylus coqui TaxID=57060 RepID=A0A8J6END7_ELECQ|nr:hypothetical protein GDO78_019705 [Eleutherodactylus coqui]
MICSIGFYLNPTAFSPRSWLVLELGVFDGSLSVVLTHCIGEATDKCHHTCVVGHAWCVSEMSGLNVSCLSRMCSRAVPSFKVRQALFTRLYQSPDWILYPWLTTRVE